MAKSTDSSLRGPRFQLVLPAPLMEQVYARQQKRQDSTTTATFRRLISIGEMIEQEIDDGGTIQLVDASGNVTSLKFI